MDTCREMKQQERSSYIAAMKTAYWLATEELPNLKYASLLNLLREQGCHDIKALRRGGNSTKESPWSLNQLIDSIDEVIISYTFKR